MYILKAKYPPFLWQCRSYFPPTLPLECLSMASPAPSLDATKHRAGTTSRDTRTHIPTEMVPGRPQTRYHTAPLSGTSIATISPNHCPAPRLIDPASGQASPAQLCVIQPRPGWHKFTLHPHHPLHPSPHLPHHNLSHHLSLDGWGLGIDGRLVASSSLPWPSAWWAQGKREERLRASASQPASLAEGCCVQKRCAVPQNLNSLSQGRPMWLIWSI